MENMTPLSRVEAILMGEPVSIPQSRVEYLLQELVDKLNELANSEIYEAKGSILFANLPTPSASNDGWVYDVTDDFVTDSRFKTGAGQAYPGGTNVVIINDGTKENPVYKYDVLGGFINMDLYVQKETGKGLSTNDYTDYEKNKLAGVATGAEVNVQSDWNESDSSSDAYIQNKPTLGTASALDVAESGNAGDNEVVKGNDSRLTDNRNPTSHTHPVSQITDFPTLGTAAGLNVSATGDASSSEVVKGDDSRIVNSPISDSVSGDAISVTNSAEGYMQGLTVYGKSRKSKNLLNPDKYVSGSVVTPSATSIRISSRGDHSISAKIGDTFVVTWSGSDYYIGAVIVNDNNEQIQDTGWESSPCILNVQNNGYVCFNMKKGASGGEAITIQNAKDANIQIEKGSTPTPYEPYGAIISIGDSGSLTITTTDGTTNSTATLTTGLPLCGIPVTTGETYTDSDGVKWLADSVDDGVVKRCYKVTFDGSEDETWDVWNSTPASDGSKAYQAYLTALAIRAEYSDIPVALSNITVASAANIYDATVFSGISVTSNLVRIRIPEIGTASALRTYLASNPVTLVYILLTPTTQELTPTEKSALLSLKTYDPTTNLTITDDPFVDFGYLKNTENGKAVEQAAENAKKQVIDDAAASNATTFSSNKIIDLISGQPKDYEIYTFRIDHDNSDPDTAVRPFIHGYGCDNYDYQNAGMDYSNDVFKYGDWANAFFIKNLKPRYLNRDGTVAYDLDKNNYKQKLDGTTASEVTDLTSSGNVMVGFPTTWVFRYMSGSYEYVVISNKQLDYRFKAWAHHDVNGNVLPYIYLSAYNGSLSDYDSATGVSTGKLRSISGIDYHNLNAITNNKILSNATRSEEINFAQRNNGVGEQGEGWYIRHKAEWDMINDLLVLIGGTTDTQTAFGNGVISGHVSATNTGIKSTGLYDDKGLFYGKNTQTDPVKVFGIENWWGNMWNSLAGWLLVNGTQKVKMTHGTEDGSTVTGFNTSGSGYVAIPNSTPSGTSGGCISSWSKSEYGMIPLVASGTSGTYLCDGLWFNNSDTKFALVGGNSNTSWHCGAFFSSLYNGAGSHPWSIGAALTYKGVA